MQSETIYFVKSSVARTSSYGEFTYEMGYICYTNGKNLLKCIDLINKKVTNENNLWLSKQSNIKSSPNKSRQGYHNLQTIVGIIKGASVLDKTLKNFDYVDVIYNTNIDNKSLDENFTSIKPIDENVDFWIFTSQIKKVVFNEEKNDLEDYDVLYNDEEKKKIINN